jgi:hypothetical protein
LLERAVFVRKKTAAFSFDAAVALAALIVLRFDCNVLSRLALVAPPAEDLQIGFSVLAVIDKRFDVIDVMQVAGSNPARALLATAVAAAHEAIINAVGDRSV